MTSRARNWVSTARRRDSDDDLSVQELSALTIQGTDSPYAGETDTVLAQAVRGTTDATGKSRTSYPRGLLVLLYCVIIGTLLLGHHAYRYYFDAVTPLFEPDQQSAPNLLPDLSPQEQELWLRRRDEVVGAFRHAWGGYRRDAFGSDEYAPVARTGLNLSSRGLGYTIVDSLDTMLLMGLTAEYHDARQWITAHLDFDIAGESVSVFETNIRVLGGLLAAYHLSGKDQLYLERAVDLADRLLTAWTSTGPYPTAKVFLARSPPGTAAHLLEWQTINVQAKGQVSLAEVGSLQLEFAYLSHITGDPKYHRRAQDVMRALHAIPTLDGLLPTFVNVVDNTPSAGQVTAGAHGDSYFEYLLKQWIQTRGHPDQQALRDMYDASVEGIKRHMIRTSLTAGVTLVGELWLPFLGRVPWKQYVNDYNRGVKNRPEFIPKAEHLACFLPGLLALGATRGYSLAAIRAGHSRRTKPHLTPRDQEDLDLAEKLAYGCWKMYNSTATGLAPEYIRFDYDRFGQSPYYTHTTGQDRHSTTANDASRPRTGWSAPAAGFGPQPKAWAIEADYIVPPDHAYNLLRPETVETLFILWRITKKPQYRDWGWQIFRQFQTYSFFKGGGYTSLKDVTVVPPEREDKMETFFLAETLKYFYLLFSPDDVLPLDQYVLNTEAHPFPILDRVTP
ncbi:mannosyl-oligosaccharide alpha-1,2-mannosidase [Tieghemiomyces parasiticus]|uniref:alpha-1,2-Mannosidase n=1 Tax=Tieghemiomyces parasiticus TaxID=78921 RepID=A0A9W8A8W1_9FUNG|nr:mannosyl-oligosaccharide alpha-1,2-mannosidase [Tieghemiomyces parasiticus]